MIPLGLLSPGTIAADNNCPEGNCSLDNWPWAIALWMISPGLLSPGTIAADDNCPEENYPLDNCPRIIAPWMIVPELLPPGQLFSRNIAPRTSAPWMNAPRIITLDDNWPLRVTVAKTCVRTAKVSSIPLLEITTKSSHLLPAKKLFFWFGLM